MTGVNVPEDMWIRWIREVLTHLYDPAFLQDHPLTQLIEGRDRVEQAKHLRRHILECIESLAPANAEKRHGNEATRVYAILTYRYVDGLSIEAIGQKLALSRRQVYREHRRGILAIARLMREQLANVPETELVEEDTTATLYEQTHLEEVDLRDVIEKALELIEPVARQRNRRIGRSLPQEPVTVIADKMMLKQALLSLLSYALGIGEGHPSVTVLAQGETCLLSVGIGEARFPLPEKGSSPSGVDIARSLLQAQGYSLEVTRDESTAWWEARIRLSTQSQSTVLVIDDQEEMVSLFRRYLSSYAVNVIGVTDPRAAVETACKLTPGLIIIDVMMPHYDGWEILRQLRGHPSTRALPIVICSVIAEPQLALSMGADAVLQKPVTQETLLATLQRYLGPLSPSGQAAGGGGE